MKFQQTQMDLLSEAYVIVTATIKYKQLITQWQFNGHESVKIYLVYLYQIQIKLEINTTLTKGQTN